MYKRTCIVPRIIIQLFLCLPPLSCVSTQKAYQLYLFIALAPLSTLYPRAQHCQLNRHYRPALRLATNRPRTIARRLQQRH